MHGMLNTMCGPDDEHSLDLVRQPDLVRASRIWFAPAGKVAVARLRGLQCRLYITKSTHFHSSIVLDGMCTMA